MEVLLGIATFVLICMYVGKCNDFENLESECNKLKANKQLIYNAQQEAYDIKKKANIYYQTNVQEANKLKQQANDFYNAKVREAWLYYNQKKAKADYVEKTIQVKVSQFPVLAQIISESLTAKDKLIADQLEVKKNPAKKAADEIRKIRLEKIKLLAENKAYKWELQYLRELIPWIEELEDDLMQPKTLFASNYDGNFIDEKDEARYWLTTEEYRKLSTTQKYQLALDRYNNRNKTNAEIGLEYERYIGYGFEQEGWSVNYNGATYGKEDMGRDLICKKDNLIYIVQCKCWSNRKHKEIHEKHINQLFGTAMVYYLKYPELEAQEILHYSVEERDSIPYMEDDDPRRKAWTDTCDNVRENILFADDGPGFFRVKRIVPVFISTVPYTETARSFGDALGVKMIVKQAGIYPQIKCNINQKGEKIYHLPFDQQYDRCVIKNKGECYVTTVVEAEALGFRRAKKWHGDVGNR